jgi:hypothetical protein
LINRTILDIIEKISVLVALRDNDQGKTNYQLTQTIFLIPLFRSKKEEKKIRNRKVYYTREIQ